MNNGLVEFKGMVNCTNQNRTRVAMTTINVPKMLAMRDLEFEALMSIVKSDPCAPSQTTKSSSL